METVRRPAFFRTHATRLGGFGLVFLAVLGVLAVLVPEGIGYPGVAGVEITKPFWPVLWVYGLENLLGAWGMILGPAVIFLFLMVVPLLDRGGGPDARQAWLGGLAGGCAGNPSRRTVGIRYVRGGPGTYWDVTPVGMKRRLGW